MKTYPYELQDRQEVIKEDNFYYEIKDVLDRYKYPKDKAIEVFYNVIGDYYKEGE